MAGSEKANPVSISELWKSVGLEELRLALRKVEEECGKFENSLRALPECDQCARVALLEQIQKTGKELGGEIISLVTLSETLKQAVGTAEEAQVVLSQNCPPACCCKSGKCPCHAK